MPRPVPADAAGPCRRGGRRGIAPALAGRRSEEEAACSWAIALSCLIYPINPVNSSPAHADEKRVTTSSPPYQAILPRDVRPPGRLRRPTKHEGEPHEDDQRMAPGRPRRLRGAGRPCRLPNSLRRRYVSDAALPRAPAGVHSAVAAVP